MDLIISNIPKNKKVDLAKWAEYTIEKWEFAVAKYKLKNTGDLLNSFHSIVTEDAGGNTAYISFAFEYYLRMIDMGVGKGVTLGERGTGKRRKRNVYNKIFWTEINRLSELFQTYYLDKAKNIIVYGTD